jgi:hypothetical protein
MAERGERWSDDVEFSDGDEFAYVPGEVLVPTASGDEAEEWINRRQPSRDGDREPIPNTSFDTIPNVEDVLTVVGELRGRGILAQPNHVLFSHCLCCGCGPHPAASWPGSYDWLSAYPFGANPFGANPFGANPFGANPFGANPFGANPFGANPFGANPQTGGDVVTNPARLFASGRARPETAAFRATGLRHHSAHPAAAPVLSTAPAALAEAVGRPTIVVIDTGIAGGGFLPASLAGVVDRIGSATRTGGTVSAEETPDEDPTDGIIDPVAGHGTFIASLIDRIVPGSHIEVSGLLNGRGDAKEADIVATLNALGDRDPAPDLLNLSFGSYTAVEMAVLNEAVRKLQAKGTVVVASAGNDASCRPSFPAAFPGVVSVGALGPSGPAHFTNYGSWVRACAPGVDVVSAFFEWDPKQGHSDLREWVRWSGTSFAAPAVVGALARAMGDGVPTAREAVERVIDDRGLFRMPGLGTVVNQTPWFVRG